MELDKLANPLTSLLSAMLSATPTYMLAATSAGSSVDSLPSRNTLITLGLALLMSLVVSWSKVGTDRAELRAQRKVVPPWSAYVPLIVFGAMAGFAGTLFLHSLMNLKFGALIATSMLGGAFGPYFWRLLLKKLGGTYGLDVPPEVVKPEPEPSKTTTSEEAPS